MTSRKYFYVEIRLHLLVDSSATRGVKDFVISKKQSGSKLSKHDLINR